jgi:hypothetical protein
MPQSRRLSHLRRAVTVHLARRLRAHPVVQSEGRLLVVILISGLSGEAAVALHHAIHVVTHLVQALGEATHGGWHTW